jgi:NADPH-dependent 2,4-dienoyl-CoA reductase/sulfur reductase-like enzyme
MPERCFDILIVGGGQAGRRAAQGARAAAPDATIAIIGEETHLPYDRPPLSKELLFGASGPRVCFKTDAASYEAARIHLMLGERATGLDLNAKTVRCASGATFGFGKLILATGSRPRRLDAPTEVADRVTTLRTLEDSARIAANLRPGARIVVIGAGFIGLEAASAALVRGARATVLEASDRVLGRVFPHQAGARVEQLHRDAGVDLRLGAKVVGFAGSQPGLCIHTEAGELEADIVIVGIGVTPNLELAQDAGLEIDDGIVVTAEGATSHPDVFAAGEVTRHPLASGARARLEAWQVAELQAEAAGRTAAGAPTVHAAIPYFWTDQLGVNIQMFGLIDPAARIVTRQDKGELLFAIDKDGRIQGAIGFNAGANISVAKRLIGAMWTPEFADPATPLRKLLRSAAKE